MNGKVILNIEIKDMDKPCPDITEIHPLWMCGKVGVHTENKRYTRSVDV